MKLLHRLLNSVGNAKSEWMQDTPASPGTFVTIALPHRVDSSNADAVAERLSKAPVRPGMSVIVDCTECTKIDSSGIGALVDQRNKFEKKGVHLVIAASNDRVKHVLRITRLDTLIAVYDTVEAAMTGVAGRESQESALAGVSGR